MAKFKTFQMYNAFKLVPFCDCNRTDVEWNRTQRMRCLDAEGGPQVGDCEGKKQSRDEIS